MATLQRWRGATFVACALLLVPLSGCSTPATPPAPSSTTQPTGETMTPNDSTPDDSRAAMLAKVAEVTTQLGGEWTSEDDPNADSCSLADGSDGVAFSALRTGPGFSDPEVVAEQARTVLEQQGFTVEKRSYPKENGRIEMIGSADAGSFITVTVNPDRSGIIAESACVAKL